MNIDCPFCKMLNISMLFDRDGPVPPDLEDKLIRFYCYNPDTNNDYCTHKGMKGICSYQQGSKHPRPIS